MADERIPILTDTPAAVRFISAEPLLEEIDLLSPILQADCSEMLDWVIVGGESGRKARPCNIEWIERVMLQCEHCGVPCFVKQLGSKPVETGDKKDRWQAIESDDGTRRIVLRDSKGGNWTEWPDYLRVRQFPEEHAHA